MLKERRFIVVVKLHHLLVLRGADLTTLLPYPNRRSRSTIRTEHRKKKKQTAGSYAQERAYSSDDEARCDEPSDDGHLATGQESGEG